MPTSNNALTESDLNEQLRVNLFNIAKECKLSYVDDDHCANKKYDNQLYLQIYVHSQTDAVKLLLAIPETDRNNWNLKIVKDDRHIWIELNVTKALETQSQPQKGAETNIEPKSQDVGSSLEIKM